MDRLPNLVEEVVESVNPREQGLPASDPSEYVRSESQTPAKPNEALLRIAQTWLGYWMDCMSLSRNI